MYTHAQREWNNSKEWQSDKIDKDLCARLMWFTFALWIITVIYRFYPSSLSSLLAKNGAAMTKVPWIDLLRLYTLKANQHQHCLAICQIPTYALKAQFHRIVHIFSQWPCSTLRLEMIFDKKYASNKRNTLTKANVCIKLTNRSWYWSTVSFHKNDDYIYIYWYTVKHLK